MRTKTCIKYVKNLSEDELKACRSLSYRQNGQMAYDVTYARKYDKTARVVMIKDESGRLIGWALTHKETGGEVSTQLYVRRQFRRKGYGTRLMKHSFKIQSRPFVYPHDTQSGKFFKKFRNNILCDHYDEWRWMKNES